MGEKNYGNKFFFYEKLFIVYVALHTSNAHTEQAKRVKKEKKGFLLPLFICIFVELITGYRTT